MPIEEMFTLFEASILAGLRAECFMIAATKHSVFLIDAIGQLPSRAGIRGAPGTPGFGGRPGSPGFSGTPGKPGQGGWSSGDLVSYFNT